MNETKLFLQNGYIILPESVKENEQITSDFEIKELDSVATVLSNMAKYGFAPSKTLFNTLCKMNFDELVSFWMSVEPEMKSETGADKEIASHILYKNFPKEVLEMSHAEYWIRQTFVYFGFPYDVVAQEKEERVPVYGELPLKVVNGVLCDEKKSVLKNITKALVGSSKRWSNDQLDQALFVFKESGIKSSFLNLEDYGFKENGLTLMVEMYEKSPKNVGVKTDESLGELKNRIAPEQYSLLMKLAQKRKGSSAEKPKESVLSQFMVKEATDVLRLASGISGGDLRVGKKMNLIAFSRADRRALLSMLENSKNLEGDVAARKDLFKRLFKALRPGDYKNRFPRCVETYDALYNNRLKSDASVINEKIQKKDESVFKIFKSRPGMFVKRFHELYAAFGEVVAKEFVNVLPKLSTVQLVQFERYVSTVNERENRLFPPKGQWQKVQQVENDKCKLNKGIQSLLEEIEKEMKVRLETFYPEGFNLCGNMDKLKLQTNDQKLANYGRGTVFDIPENIRFIRTSSYWDINVGSFLDNTWNFFDENWEGLGACCWDHESFYVKEDSKELYAEKGHDIEEYFSEMEEREESPDGKAAVFSGDAVNRENGKAAQLIDLYLDELESQGVRYAVWSVLSYSNIPFDDFNDAHAGMQMGEEPEKGEVFEASRVNLSFPLKEKEKTKIIAYVDIKERKIIYCDVNKSLLINSGGNNRKTLEEFMPAYVEYLNALPSYHDVFGYHVSEKGIPMMYSDKEFSFESEVEKAFVFKKENSENIYKEEMKDFNEFLNFKRE